MPSILNDYLSLHHIKSPVIIFFVFQLLQGNVNAQPTEGNEVVTNVMNFSWMPNGKSICFAVIRSDRARKHPPSTAIFKYDLKTRKTILLVKNAHSPSVSPDGTRIAYTKTSGGLMGNNDVYIYDLETKTEQPIVTDTLRESSPSWSPDSKKLVYTVASHRTKDHQYANLDLWVIELSTGEKKQITLSSGIKNFNPVWATKGNKIVYYLEKGDNRDQIYLTDEEGSFHTNLTSDTTTHNYYPSWYGKQIMYTRSPNQIIITTETGKNKSKMEGLEAFWAKYTAKSNRIAFLTPGSRMKPSDLKIFDIRTKLITSTISPVELNKLDF